MVGGRVARPASLLFDNLKRTLQETGDGPPHLAASQAELMLVTRPRLQKRM